MNWKQFFCLHAEWETELEINPQTREQKYILEPQCSRCGKHLGATEEEAASRWSTKTGVYFILVLVIVFALAALLTGCGSEESGDVDRRFKECIDAGGNFSSDDSYGDDFDCTMPTPPTVTVTVTEGL